MSRLNPTIVTLAMISGVYGCNSAEFSQQRGPKSKGTIEQVSCKVMPSVVIPGEAVSVAISGASNYKGRFEQTVALEGAVISQQIISRQEDGYRPADGQPNQFTFNKQGNYQVELREIDYNAGVSASCSFKVFKECPEGTERVGANVAFILDNSGSHGKTDCVGSKKTSKADGTVAYSCSEETNREKAVKYAVDILAKVGESGGKASSFISMASFPNSAISGYQIGKSGWTEAASSALSEDLLVTRKPYGMTPYGEGLEATERLFDLTPDLEKAKIAIFVTDGLPTDKDPIFAMEKAQALKANGVRVISVLVSPNDNDELISNHKSFINKIGGEDNPWYSIDYTSSDDYFDYLLGNGDNLKGVLDNMSDQVIYVKEAKQLKDTFESIISEQAISCE